MISNTRMRGRVDLAVFLLEMLLVSLNGLAAQAPGGSPQKPAPAAIEHNERRIAPAHKVGRDR